MKTFKIKKTLSIIIILTFGIFLFSMCQKSELSSESNSQIKTDSQNRLSMVDSTFATLSGDTVKILKVYDNCATYVGNIVANASGKIYYSSQTSSAVTLTGATGITLTKGSFYYFRKSTGCTSGKYLKVKFATGIQTTCNSFNLNGCTWSLNSSCAIVNSYSFVASLPTPC